MLSLAVWFSFKMWESALVDVSCVVNVQVEQLQTGIKLQVSFWFWRHLVMGSK